MDRLARMLNISIANNGLDIEAFSGNNSMTQRFVAGRPPERTVRYGREQSPADCITSFSVSQPACRQEGRLLFRLTEYQQSRKP